MVEPSQRPNVLLIVCDQLRQDALGCYGNRAVRTPHIDRLGAQSVQYTRAYATTPLCVPARTSMLTGRYAHTVGVALHAGTPTGEAGICRHFVNLTDLAPTICALASVEPLPEMSGCDLLALHRGDVAPREHCIGARAADRNSWAALLTPQWRYYYFANGGDEELFAHDEAQEDVNLAHDAQYASVLDELRRTLTEELQSIETHAEDDAPRLCPNGELLTYAYQNSQHLASRYVAH